MDVKMMAVEEIQPYEKNAKKHPEDQVEHIANSIREFGWQQPLVVDKDNVLVIGHGRLLAAKHLGLTEIPVVRADQLSEQQIAALRLADNKTNESAWDFNLLDADLGDLFDFDMSRFGFDITTISPDGFGDNFSLPDGEKSEICTMTFTLHEEQKALIDYALSIIGDNYQETFGNTNKNGNALYEVVRQWAEQRK